MEEEEDSPLAEKTQEDETALEMRNRLTCSLDSAGLVGSRGSLVSQLLPGDPRPGVDTPKVLPACVVRVKDEESAVPGELVEVDPQEGVGQDAPAHHDWRG